jgi:hypothetical protein
LQPKKPNWDLKRELETRLEPLNKKTQVALAEIIRKSNYNVLVIAITNVIGERLKSQKDISDTGAADAARHAYTE